MAISLKRRFMTDLQIRIDTKLKETVRQYANENGYSMADVIRVALVEKFCREKFLGYDRLD